MHAKNLQNRTKSFSLKILDLVENCRIPYQAVQLQTKLLEVELQLLRITGQCVALEVIENLLQKCQLLSKNRMKRFSGLKSSKQKSLSI